MCRLALLAISLAVLLASAGPNPLQAQDRSPELQTFEYFIGEWRYGSEENPGTMSFEWHGQGFLKCEETTPNGRKYFHFWGYDQASESYHGCRFSTTGYWDCSEGWLEGKSYTWIFEGPLNRLRRIVLTMESEDSYTFTWSRSLNGGEWEVGTPGRATRVRN